MKRHSKQSVHQTLDHSAMEEVCSSIIKGSMMVFLSVKEINRTLDRSAMEGVCSSIIKGSMMVFLSEKEIN